MRLSQPTPKQKEKGWDGLGAGDRRGGGSGAAWSSCCASAGASALNAEQAGTRADWRAGRSCTAPGYTAHNTGTTDTFDGTSTPVGWALRTRV
ncbi:hypothetical protein GCM10010448_04490 [Streptomyces glomeratus]|uniref:Uncharacterized protein n=1 Tax=Streptomyces glomeratus TaxID=284452 RepID=A0ABN3YEM0_9ACTN